LSNLLENEKYDIILCLKERTNITLIRVNIPELFWRDEMTGVFEMRLTPKDGSKDIYGETD
jgi:hypothetical protein